MRYESSLKKWIRYGPAALLLLGVVWADMPAANGQNGQDMVLLPSDRLIVGTVAEVAADQVKVYTAEVMPRYLSGKQAREKGFWPLSKGDHVHIVVNEQNMVLGYHLVGDMGSHYIIRGRLTQPLIVGQQWAVIQEDGKEEQTYRVRALVRSKLAAVSVGSPAVFLIDETNQIMDTAFGSKEALRTAAQGWQGSPPKGVNRQLTGTIVNAMADGEVTIRNQNGLEQTVLVRSFLQDKIERLATGDLVILLIDDEDKVADVAFLKLGNTPGHPHGQD